MKDPAAGIPWTEEAEERLKNVPAFVRPMVRRRIEQMAADEGAERITVEMMEEARQRFEKF
ncbi:MAG: PCP reductase family protein [Nitrospirae bacterium]|nr:PCP reductase family protein [Nitrospirota bacterium]